MRNYFVSYVIHKSSNQGVGSYQHFGMTNFESNKDISISVIKEWQGALVKKFTCGHETPSITIISFKEIAKIESL